MSISRGSAVHCHGGKSPSCGCRQNVQAPALLEDSGVVRTGAPWPRTVLDRAVDADRGALDEALDPRLLGRYDHRLKGVEINRRRKFLIELEARIIGNAGEIDDRLDSLDLLRTDIEQSNAWPVEIEHDAGHGCAHDGHVDEVSGIGADRRPDVKHDAFAARKVGHMAAIAGRSI
jgi:hypothetical protein